VRRVPPAQIGAGLPVLRNPANRHRAVGFTPEQFHYAFANTLSREESDEVYERYHIPAPGSFIWGAVLANFEPGNQEGYDNFNNDDRAPLLLIAGGEDHLQPASVNESNFKHYRNSKAITEFKEFPGRAHYTLGQDGWGMSPTTRLSGPKSTLPPDQRPERSARAIHPNVAEGVFSEVSSLPGPRRRDLLSLT
jgi:pimeloyl-ACP methyl ester carboxylesterase